MPKVHKVLKARKDYPEAGIKKGDTYYWWKFRYGGKHRSKNYPKPSQLTQSSFLSELHSIKEEWESAATDFTSNVEELKSCIELLKEECEMNLDNIPYQLQETSQAGEILQERIEALEEWNDAMDDVLEAVTSCECNL